MSYQIVAFYKFMRLSNLEELKEALLKKMYEFEIFGTIILAEEGVNAAVLSDAKKLENFLISVEEIFKTSFEYKFSYYDKKIFKRQKIKIKNEIVTFRKHVDIELGEGTHVDSAEWNEILKDPEVLVLDTRNDYEYRVGTFPNALNPKTNSFNQLPEFVEQNLDPKTHKKIAMFCTGGIRCEKFAPYLKSKGFENVFQLKGGILKYFEDISEHENLWEGECFVFDERITVDDELKKGAAPDFSYELKNSAQSKDSN